MLAGLRRRVAGISRISERVCEGERVERDWHAMVSKVELTLRGPAASVRLYPGGSGMDLMEEEDFDLLWSLHRHQNRRERPKGLYVELTSMNWSNPETRWRWKEPRVPSSSLASTWGGILGTCDASFL